MPRKEICVSRWSFTKNHYMMQGPQNVKLRLGVIVIKRQYIV